MREPGERFVTFAIRADGDFPIPQTIPQNDEAARDFVERSNPRATVEGANHPPKRGMSSEPTREMRIEDREPTLDAPRLPRGRGSNRPTARSIPPTPNASERLHRRQEREAAERVEPLIATPLRETSTDARFAEPFSRLPTSHSPLPGAERP